MSSRLSVVLPIVTRPGDRDRGSRRGFKSAGLRLTFGPGIVLVVILGPGLVVAGREGRLRGTIHGLAVDVPDVAILLVRETRTVAAESSAPASGCGGAPRSVMLSMVLRPGNRNRSGRRGLGAARLELVEFIIT